MKRFHGEAFRQKERTGGALIRDKSRKKKKTVTERERETRYQLRDSQK